MPRKDHYVLAETDVVHIRKYPSKALCGYRFVGEWWTDRWCPDNYPMCGRCARLSKLPRKAAPQYGQSQTTLRRVVSGGLPSLGKRR